MCREVRVFLETFYRELRYTFGNPQVNVCSTCEDLNLKIKSSTLNEAPKSAAVSELIIYIRRAKKYYNKIQDVAKICRVRNNIKAIGFDFIQNLPLGLCQFRKGFTFISFSITSLILTILATYLQCSTITLKAKLKEALMRYTLLPRLR